MGLSSQCFVQGRTKGSLQEEPPLPAAQAKREQRTHNILETNPRLVETLAVQSAWKRSGTILWRCSEGDVARRGVGQAPMGLGVGC